MFIAWTCLLDEKSIHLYTRCPSHPNRRASDSHCVYIRPHCHKNLLTGTKFQVHVPCPVLWHHVAAYEIKTSLITSQVQFVAVLRP